MTREYNTLRRQLGTQGRGCWLDEFEARAAGAVKYLLRFYMHMLCLFMESLIVHPLVSTPKEELLMNFNTFSNTMGGEGGGSRCSAVPSLSKQRVPCTGLDGRCAYRDRPSTALHNRLGNFVQVPQCCCSSASKIPRGTKPDIMSRSPPARKTSRGRSHVAPHSIELHLHIDRTILYGAVHVYRRLNASALLLTVFLLYQIRPCAEVLKQERVTTPPHRAKMVTNSEE